jgi:hypothetical protein
VGELFQWVTIPAGANPVRWEFWWRAEAGSSQPGDRLVAWIEYSGGEATLRELRADAPLNQWRMESVELTPYAGHRVLIGFRAVTDGSVPTTFRIDDVSVQACGGAGAGQ